MDHLSRRTFLQLTAATGAGAFAPASALFAQTAPVLTVAKRTLDVKGKAATVFAINGAGGGNGLTLGPGQPFLASLANRAGEATIVHWHGQTPPPHLDGVTDTGYAAPIADGASATYEFAARPGTHWMHSHHGLQEQNLLAAPLIVHTADDLKADRQEVVVLLHDFTFKPPGEVAAGLTTMSGMMAGGHDMHAMGGMDLNDVEYDAYLANDRTLADPQVVRTERNGKVLLRIINASSSTNFWIDLGAARADAVAVDGNGVAPLSLSRFPLAVAQRLDLLVTVPAGAAVPVVALREGDRQQTGIILAAPAAAVAKVPELAARAAAALDLNFEGRLAAQTPLAARKVDVTHKVALTGAMMPYRWSLNDRSWENRLRLTVARGNRVAIEFDNRTMMAHPMHLHGHHFQVVALNGRSIGGAVRDTVLVPPMVRVTVAFDADNVGRWLLHCHNLYHMATGMMTELVYGEAA